MTTLTVGAGSGFEFSTLASAIAASQDGDVIKVQPGTYTNDFAAVTTSITIIGVGGLVNLVATQAPPDLKGILTIGTAGGSGPDVTIDNVAFSGVAIPNDAGGNGAGIRYQSGNLTLNNCFFHDNQEGLLADPDTGGTITINNSEFINNGNANPPDSGVEHNLYVGQIQQLTINNSYFDNPIVGHDIKSRAANTTIENSRIYDQSSSGSLEIDLPNGGNGVIENNVIEKGPNAQNSNLVSSGEEGNAYANPSLIVTGNTLINDDGGGVTGVVNDTGAAASVTGNTIYGVVSDQLVNGPVSSPENNSFPRASAPALDVSAPYMPFFACFVAGTRILTAHGQVPVEALRAGQQVVVAGAAAAAQTPRDRMLLKIRWVGHRYIDLTRHADLDLAQPIRIRAAAFADGVPARDLLISRDHAIFTDGLLIPARLLLNGATIVREVGLRSVRYFHVELDRHDILLAEGLQAESYLDTGNRGIFENANVPLVLHPDLGVGGEQARREVLSCAPFAADAERVRPVWWRLATRASMLGFVIAEPPTTNDPALRLLVDGRERWPAAVKDDWRVFEVPQSAASVRLISRSAAPCDIAPWVEDRRRLGVAVRRIVISGPAGRFDIAPDNPALLEGWWPAERDGSKLWCWTNGDAVLSLPSGAAIVAIHLVGRNTYLREMNDEATDSGRSLAAVME